MHAGNRLTRDDRGGQQALAVHILRNAFTEQKITDIEDSGKVLCRFAMTYGSNKKNFEIFTAEEFIAVGDAVKLGLLTDAIGAGCKAAQTIDDIVHGRRLRGDVRKRIDYSRMRLEYFDPRF